MSELEWKYTAEKDVGTGEATVVVMANDLAGNVVERTVEKSLGE